MWSCKAPQQDSGHFWYLRSFHLPIPVTHLRGDHGSDFCHWQPLSPQPGTFHPRTGPPPSPFLPGLHLLEYAWFLGQSCRRVVGWDIKGEQRKVGEEDGNAPEPPQAITELYSGWLGLERSCLIREGNVQRREDGWEKSVPGEGGSMVSEKTQSGASPTWLWTLTHQRSELGIFLATSLVTLG